MKRFAFLVLAMGLAAVSAEAQQKKTSSKSNDGWGSSGSGWGSSSGWDAPASKPAAKPKTATKATAPAKTTPNAAAPSGTAAPAAANATATTPASGTGATGDASQAMGGQGTAGATGNAANGGFGDVGAGDRTPERIEGMSVAPGRPLMPSGRTRSDYMGRPIQAKPSMRPRSTDNNQQTDLLNTAPGQRP
ncbi:hypothetical protein D3Y59_11915 [Hymenobacter oligotrophus]|uniref:Uncharacterized protein n=1 Tax=Hymenobacter oligotrophus TaxID=2319843 RepID=A0A3B7R9B5_9BACT|nr:hypothetical protein [Hymenobacter oligotrophus]AYA37691.1 hypothetical protein D3Y59_11915 [Hymenobacter oligotrophus]